MFDENREMGITQPSFVDFIANVMGFTVQTVKQLISALTRAIRVAAVGIALVVAVYCC